jgi:dynein heavy chain 2
MKISPPSETGSDSPVTSFVLLERYNAITLVQTVHASLAALSKVIRGTQLLSSEVQALAGSLLKQEVCLNLVITCSTSISINNTRIVIAAFI